MAWTTPRTWADPEVVDDTIMNAHIRDNLLIIGEHKYVRKTATENRSTTTTLANDSELLIALGASQTWEWHLVARITAGASGGLKWTVAAPSGSTGAYFALEEAGEGSTSWGDIDAAYGDVGSVTSALAFTGSAVGIVVTSATPGNLAFQWAQNASDAGATSVLEQSWLSARRIS